MKVNIFWYDVSGFLPGWEIEPELVKLEQIAEQFNDDQVLRHLEISEIVVRVSIPVLHNARVLEFDVIRGDTTRDRTLVTRAGKVDITAVRQFILDKVASIRKLLATETNHEALLVYREAPLKGDCKI